MKVIMLFSILFCSCVIKMNKDCNTNQLVTGLYYGQKGGFFPPYLIYVTIKEEPVIEVFQPLQGQILCVLKDILHVNQNKSNNVLFIGKKISLCCDGSGLFVEQLLINNHSKLKKVYISFNPDKNKELNEYRNRAFLFEDNDATVKMIEGKIGKSENTSFKFEKLQYKYGVMNLAKTLPNEKFLKEYFIIREKIVNEIIISNRK